MRLREQGALIIALSAFQPCTARAQFVSPRVVVGVPGGWRPIVLNGAEARGEIGDGTSRVDSMGVTHRVPPVWLWSIAGFGGASFARDGRATDDVRATAEGQLGFLYRASGTVRVGAYGVGIVEPRSVGVVLHFEPASPAAIQAGWLRRTRTHDNGVLVQVDVGLGFLVDLVKGGGR